MRGRIGHETKPAGVALRCGLRFMHWWSVTPVLDRLWPFFSNGTIQKPQFLSISDRIAIC
jgi:hypothetical protein